MKVINIKSYRILKEQRTNELVYRHKLIGMDKAQLLQELLNYHESFQNDPHDITATLRGQHLLDVLEERAELKELRDLAREFQHKLKVRLYGQMQKLLKN